MSVESGNERGISQTRQKKKMRGDRREVGPVGLKSVSKRKSVREE